MSQKKKNLPLWLELSKWGRVVVLAALVLAGANDVERNSTPMEGRASIVITLSLE